MYSHGGLRRDYALSLIVARKNVGIILAHYTLALAPAALLFSPIEFLCASREGRSNLQSRKRSLTVKLKWEWLETESSQDRCGS